MTPRGNAFLGISFAAVLFAFFYVRLRPFCLFPSQSPFFSFRPLFVRLSPSPSSYLFVLLRLVVCLAGMNRLCLFCDATVCVCAARVWPLWLAGYLLWSVCGLYGCLFTPLAALDRCDLT